MINVINDTIERTHRLTGMDKDEIAHRMRGCLTDLASDAAAERNKSAQ